MHSGCFSYTRAVYLQNIRNAGNLRHWSVMRLVMRMLRLFGFMACVSNVNAFCRVVTSHPSELTSAGFPQGYCRFHLASL